MASGWANDDAVQEQIDSTINDAIARARNELSSGESNKFCEECGEPIPEARRRAVAESNTALNANRRKIYITIHFRDIIAEDPKTASFADRYLPFITAYRINFSRTFLANGVANVPFQPADAAPTCFAVSGLNNLLIFNKLIIIQKLDRDC